MNNLVTKHAKCDSEKQALVREKDKIEKDLNELVTEHAKCEPEKQTLGREKDSALKELKTLAAEHAKCEPEKIQLQREKVLPHTSARGRARYDYQKSASDVYSLRHPSCDTVKKFHSVTAWMSWRIWLGK